MNIFEVSWQVFNLFLFVILIIILVVALRLVVKKKISFKVATVIVTIGVLFIIEFMKYTTFEKVYIHQLNEESIVENITIELVEFTDDHFPERYAHVTIRDEKIIDEIIEDLTSMRLKKDTGEYNFPRDYFIRILTTNMTKDNYLITDSFSFTLDDQHMNDFEIVNDTNHLKTIEELVEDKDVDWIFREE
ncbi:hypothetical protein [Halalkalibacter alkaliphilus]|uniref:Uncharacterized protein n=1 Tax=Halalkalibacter alkaliphilus TaxID=2917993 RepID=A0A9X2CV45_9BACI|nr:hypothetical protein [Halalkalibacter alkaliphilus]MCL7748439.1 hypothetical protein [Halalkalibacter alkaliphilus]